MPSHSHQGSMDGEYEWDEPAQDHKKKSRSKLPPEDKLNKRRDQNRVSQRAFRQRKEKHTKELEAKVEELETLLESASHENSVVTSQMSRMEQELCYYRRLLFAGGNGNSQGIGLSPPASEASANSSYTSNYTTASSYPTYSPIPATASLPASSYTLSPASNASSSANSSPSLGNIPGDFGGNGVGVDSYWGYDVPQTTPGYLQFNTSGAGNSWQSQSDGW